MLGRVGLVVGVLLIVAFAGCLGDATGSGAANARHKAGVVKGGASLLRGLTPSVEPLWYDPETAPHPAYNYPTLSHPANNTSNKWLQPIPAAKMPTKITGLTHVAQVEGMSEGRGMSLIGSIAIEPSSKGTFYVDISNPLKPKVVGQSPGATRGSDTIVYPDGRIFAVLATGTANILLIDITNPAAPGDPIPVDVGSTHKVDVVPGTPIIYNSANGKIVDATNPDAPVVLPNMMPASCHRTYFYIEPKENYYRAICASYRNTELWDIKDPSKPVQIISIPMWHAQQGVPGVTPGGLSHFAILSHNHKTLIVGDETGGGAIMACTAAYTMNGKTYSGPTGALWFYDVTNEKDPKLKSWMSPTVPWASSATAAPCTAHHGRLVPDPQGKRDLLAMGFYGAGVVLVDFTDPASPFIVDQWDQGTNVWEAWYYNGYVFTGDMARGLDTIGFK